MKIDVGRFIGIPYVSHGRSFEGCDCFGMYWLVLCEHGVQVPSYDSAYIDAAERQETRRAIEENVSDWVEVETPEEGDAVLLRAPSHIGVYLIGGQMLHVREGVCACVESLDSPEYRRRVKGFYRHRSLLSSGSSPSPSP